MIHLLEIDRAWRKFQCETLGHQWEELVGPILYGRKCSCCGKDESHYPGNY